MDGQLAIVAVVALAAAAYLVRSARRTWTRSGCGSGCGSCRRPAAPEGKTRRVSLL